LAVAALLFLPWLGARDLWNPNEPIYGQAVREMASAADWLVPTVRGQVFAEKPILYYWIALAASSVTGAVDETSLRLPSVLAALLLVAMTWALVRPYAGTRRATLASLLLSSTYMVWWGARTAQMDVLVAATTVGALFPLSRTVDFGLSPWKGWALTGVACGLGVLAKGPIAIVCPGIAFAAYLATTGRLLGRRSALRPLPMLAGAAAFCAVLAPWLVALASRGRLAMLEEMFLRQNLTRFVAAWDHRQPFWYYGVHVWAGMVPWSLLLPAAVALPERSDSERRLDRLAWCWLLGVVLFLSLSQSKRNDYLLPVAAAVAVLASAPLGRWLTGGLVRWRAVWVTGVHVFLAVGLLGAAYALAQVAPRKAPVLAGAGPLAGGLLLVGATILLVALVLRRRRGAALAVWGSVAAFYLVAAGSLLPTADAFKSAQPFSRELSERVPASQPIASYRFWQWRAGYAFYTDRTFDSLQSPDELRAWASLPGPRWLLVEEWALPEARAVLGSPPVALSASVGHAEIALLGPLRADSTASFSRSAR
jgi:4-amino-4-deoxy-L-arabinose transferase-like glycosyltransferase